MQLRALLFAALVAAAAAGCSGPGHVEYVSGQCLLDGRAATLPQVEIHQALVQSRIEGRQPWLTAVTILVLVLAGAGHIEKLLALFSTRKSDARGLAERLKLSLERYRAHPVRYFAIVAATFVALMFAAGAYVYLDVDKRASERAQNMLNFCHLALRTADEQGVLDQQRANLLAIQNTAGDIRALVDKLPPEEQRKAQLIVDQMNSALGRQGKLVSEYLAKTDASTKAVREHTAVVERGLSSVEANVLNLKSLPAGLHDLSELVHKLDGRVQSLDGKVVQGDQRADARLAALEAAVKAIAARPAPACPPAAPATAAATAPTDGGARTAAATH
jgi:hypothetical protein